MTPTSSISAEHTALEMSSYDAVAVEYYDTLKHPTCADFRRASQVALERYVHRLGLQRFRARCLELGAGRSLVSEVLDGRVGSVAGLTVTDASELMLRHSAHWEGRVESMLVARAERLPFEDGAFDTVFACLGDPYNTVEAWRSVHRVLAAGGQLFMTTPSLEWASYFRLHHQSALSGVAEFELRDAGSRVLVPSFVLPVANQVEVFAKAGLTIVSVEQIVMRDVPGGTSSRKLSTPLGDALPVITAYVATRSGP